MINVEVVKEFIDKRFSYLGINKKQEVTRLFYEISKRERRSPYDIISDIPDSSPSFLKLKNYLIKRRFPSLRLDEAKKRYPLSALNINSHYKIDIEKKKFKSDDIYPSNIYIEKSVLKSDLTNRVKSEFPESNFRIISSYEDYIKQLKPYTIAHYNKRRNHFFIIREKFDFFKKCPCSFKSVSCGYHVINLGSGCLSECVYCFLQNYINSPGIVLPANIEDFFETFKKYKQNIRLGSGELTDSLIFDHITGYSPKIIEFFKHYPESIFEFKTKSNNIKLLTSVIPGNNIVVSWSINPQFIIDSCEFYTSSLSERFEAAMTCVNSGYKVGFHFDPIIYYDDWEKDYRNLVNEIFDRIDADRITWLSLGMLRLTPRLRKIIENRFPENTILDGELVLGYDEKYRYPKKLRYNVYKKLSGWIKKRAPKIFLYLCMEGRKLIGENRKFDKTENLSNI